MIKNKTKKIISIIALFLILINSFQGIVSATEINSAYIENLGECERHLQYYKTEIQNWSYIITTMVGYRDNGTTHYAYCLNAEKDGVGEVDNYTVSVNEILSDPKVYTTIINGFPYKSPAELGVENEQDAFVATKQAVYSVMYDRNVDTYYRGADERGERIVNAIRNMVNKARYETQTPVDANVLNVTKIGQLKKEGTYYTQEYEVSSNAEVSNYTISNITDFPEGSYIAGVDNNARTTFSGGEHFKIVVPEEKIVRDFNGNIQISGAVKSYPVFLGKTPNSEWQDYALTYNAYVTVGGQATLSMEAYKSGINIIKTDKETGEVLSGVTYNAKYSDGTNIGNFTTDKNGRITISKLRQGKVILTEVSTQNEYILDTTPINVDLKYNQIKTVELTNQHKKGNLKIIKVDKDDNDITLGAVEFDLIDSNKKVVAHLVTDVNGEAEVNNINTGNYILRETSTKKEYNLALDQDVTVKWNQTSNIKIENEKKKGQIKIIKVDADYNETKLEGVEFQIIDKNNFIIETIKTDSNGEAATSRIPIGEYKIKEVSLGTNEEYILNDEIKTIKVEEGKIKNVQFENERQKGNIKIYKVDLDDNTIPVSDVEFEVTDQDGYKYIAKSDENGIAYIEDIRTGIASIKEIKTNKIYKLSNETYSAEINWNGTTEITITNEKLKGQIEVFKVDAEDNEIKLEGVEFQVINSNNEVIENITTNQEGYAITSRIPIGEYRLKEVKTDNMHILNEEIIKVDVTADIVSKLEITNERIKGQIKVVKISEDDNFINDKEAGNPIGNVKFEIYDSNNNIVDKIITSDDGIAITKLLDKGCYFIKEVESGEWYLLNENIFEAEIEIHGETVEVNITNESEKPDVDIEKDGIIQTTANQEIKYDFNIKNTGNTKLDNFVWTDTLPTDYVVATRLITGTYNQELKYSIYYKTNKNDYRLLEDNLNTHVNNYIDFTNLQLEADEYVTEFKADFGTVDVGFESLEKPQLFVKVKDIVKNDDTFTNKTRIEGYNKTYLVWDEDIHTTKVYEKKIEIRLPRTGF